MTEISRIVFVWNADFSISGGINAIKEVVSGHHTCTLCEIAYHRVMQTSEWTAYKSELREKYSARITQPCRNQLSKKEMAAAANDYPTVLAYTTLGVKKLLSSNAIDSCDGNFYAFKSKLDSALSDLRSSFKKCT